MATTQVCRRCADTPVSIAGVQAPCSIPQRRGREVIQHPESGTLTSIARSHPCLFRRSPYAGAHRGREVLTGIVLVLHWISGTKSPSQVLVCRDRHMHIGTSHHDYSWAKVPKYTMGGGESQCRSWQ